MKLYTDFSQEELATVETVINKVANNDYIENNELKVFNAYKKALESAIENYEQYWADKDPIKELKEIFDNAHKEYDRIRNIHTFDIQKVCEYIVLNRNYNNPRTIENIAERVLGHLGGVTEQELQFSYEILCHSEDGQSAIKTVRKLTTPLKKRKWNTIWNRATEYYPTETPMDATQLYNGKVHYIYIQSKNQARWGESYWISDNCSNDLESLPVIKAFKEFNFEIGKCYKVECTNVIRWGNNKCKYEMSIEECSEEDFMEQGFIQYAKR